MVVGVVVVLPATVVGGVLVALATEVAVVFDGATVPITALDAREPELLSSRIWSPMTPTITARPTSTAPRTADGTPPPLCCGPPGSPGAGAVIGSPGRPGSPRCAHGDGGRVRGERGSP